MEDYALGSALFEGHATAGALIGQSVGLGAGPALGHEVTVP